MSQPMQAEAVTAIHDAQAVDVTSLTKDDTEVAVTPLARSRETNLLSLAGYVALHHW